MSSCLVLQQNKNIFIASDTAISSLSSGKRVRISNSAKKTFVKDNYIVFCSGKMTVANLCKDYILSLDKITIDKVQEYVASLDIEDMFELFIAELGEFVKTYQLSSYNNFIPVERVVEENTEIFALGFNTECMLESFESNLSQFTVLDSLVKSYKDNICNEVGGNVDLYYYYNGTLCQTSCELRDNTVCELTSSFTENLHFVIAEQLIGKVILSDKLFIGNGRNTFKILPEGLYIYDNTASQDLRVFLGIDTDNKAKLRLYSSNGSKSLVLSEEGIYNCYQISDRDSFDYVNSFRSYFYIPNTLQKTFEAKLIVQLQPFRAYSKTASAGGGVTKTSGGAGRINITSDTMDGGGVAESYTSEEWAGQHVTQGPRCDDSPGVPHFEHHWHWVDTRHKHRFNIRINPHKHNFKVTQDEHFHNIQIDPHTHNPVYGIYENNSIPTVKVYLAGREVATMNAQTTFLEIDVTQWFDIMNKGSNTVEFRTTDTKGLARASFTLFWSGFYSYA